MSFLSQIIAFALLRYQSTANSYGQFLINYGQTTQDSTTFEKRKFGYIKFQPKAKAKNYQKPMLTQSQS